MLDGLRNGVKVSGGVQDVRSGLRAVLRILFCAVLGGALCVGVLKG